MQRRGVQVASGGGEQHESLDGSALGLEAAACRRGHRGEAHQRTVERVRLRVGGAVGPSSPYQRAKEADEAKLGRRISGGAIVVDAGRLHTKRGHRHRRGECRQLRPQRRGLSAC